MWRRSSKWWTNLSQEHGNCSLALLVSKRQGVEPSVRERVEARWWTKSFTESIETAVQHCSYPRGKEWNCHWKDRG